MKSIKKIIALVLASLFIIGALATGVSAEESDGLYRGNRTDSIVWDIPSDTDAYTRHRIPGIVVTKQDTVIVYCEARDERDFEGTAGDSADWCRMDILIQRSEDGGKTFGEPIYIARGGEGNYGITVNNPTMIVGNDNTLHLLFCSDYAYGDKGDMYYTKSTDDGKTWTTPTSVMNDAINASYDCVAFGPTHGICTRDGVLMAPVWTTDAGNGSSHSNSKARVFYSTNGGATWTLTNQIATNQNETTLAELSDGSIMANSRGLVAGKCRQVTVCTNFVTSSVNQQWTGTGYPPELIDPGCCGSILGVDVEGLPYMLLTSNCASQNARVLVTVRCSFDDGQSYELSMQISSASEGGYSDIAVDSTGKAYVLYEVDAGKQVKLTTFSLKNEFCNMDHVMNEDMELVFDNEDTVSMISEYKNVEGELKDGALHVVTKKSSSAKSMDIDLSEYTRMLDMSDYKYMMFKVRVDPSTAADTEFEFYFRSGWKATNDPMRSAATIVKNDGEWHTVFVDLSTKGIEGTVQSIQMRMESTGSKSDIVTADIGGIAFFKTAEETEDFEFTVTSVPTDTDTDNGETDAIVSDTTPADTDEDDKGGCGSTVVGGIALVSTLAVGAFLTIKKRKE